MQPDLLIAVLAGLGGMLGWGFADFFAKKTIDAVGDLVSLVYAHISGTTILGLVILYQIFIANQSVSLPASTLDWVGLLFFGILQAIVYFLIYKGFGKGTLALLNPIFSSYAGIAALLSIVILGEVVNIKLLSSLAIIFIGVILLSLHGDSLRAKKVRLNKIPGLSEIGAATILAAVWTFGWGHFVGGKDWLSYAFFMYLFMTGTMWVMAFQQKVTFAIKNSSIWKFFLFIGLGETIAYLSISYGFSVTTHISVIALLSGAFSLPVIILSYLFLKEKVTALQTAGALVIIAGVALLSL